MSIQERRYDIIEKVMQLDDQALELIESSLKSLDIPFERTSVGQYNKELEEANKRIDSGKFISQEDLEKESGKW